MIYVYVLRYVRYSHGTRGTLLLQHVNASITEILYIFFDITGHMCLRRNFPPACPSHSSPRCPLRCHPRCALQPPPNVIEWLETLSTYFQLNLAKSSRHQLTPYQRCGLLMLPVVAQSRTSFYGAPLRRIFTHSSRIPNTCSSMGSRVI